MIQDVLYEMNEVEIKYLISYLINLDKYAFPFKEHDHLITILKKLEVVILKEVKQNLK